ncbi:alanine dehydrogenase [Candidatus Caldipriscus sp.]|nr:alanine dehydrogenase [Candidatus Caldipriscus sp.]
MIVGVPKEIKTEEYRVSMTPAGVKELIKRGHKVIVQEGAGLGAGFKDEDYKGVGAEIVKTLEEVYDKAELIVKVKEPQPEEYKLLHEGHILFTYLHLAADENLTRALMERKIVGIAYETVETDDGYLPLLAPMSEIAGKMAPQEGAKYLEKPQGGLGVLLGGVPGVPPAKVVVIGAGTVGMNATMVAAGMGADVTLMDINVERLRRAEEIIPANVKTLFSTDYTIREAVKNADLVIGAVLITGAKAPKILTRDILREMKEGAVLVDVSIDQGGISEFSRPTTHKDPVFVAEGVVHYCVANMPGAVPRTSTFALTNSTLKYVIKLADMGWKDAVRSDKSLARGVNLVKGFITHKAVAEAFGLDYHPVEEFI